MDRRRLVPLLIGAALAVAALAGGAALLLDDERAPPPGVRPVAASEPAPPAPVTVPLVPPAPSPSPPSPPSPPTAPTPATQPMPTTPALRAVRAVALDDATGKPLPGAKVSARRVGDETREPSRAIADAQGVATFAAPADELEVVAIASGYLVPDPVRLGAGAGEVELRLVRGRTLRGTVRADGLAGLPPGARVELEGEAAARLADEVALGRDGSFAVEGVARGALAVVARAPGFAPARRELGPDATDAGVLVLRRARLVVSVLAGDAPLRADLRVECRTHDAERDVTELPGGRAEVELPDGQWAVRAAQEGAASPWQLVTVGDAGPSPAEVQLRLAAPVVVAGRVLGPDGSPAPGAAVAVRQTTTSARLATDAEGRFQLRTTPGDPVQLRATQGELRSAARTVVAPAAGVDLHLAALVPLLVKPFVGRDGKPLRGALQVDPGAPDAHDLSDPGDPFEAAFDAEGRPGVAGLEPGRWTLSFVEPAPAGELRAWRREVEADPARPLELAFDGTAPRGSVTGRVAGAPKEGLVQVDLLPAAPSPDAFGFVAAAQARPDGGFAFGEVPPGRYRCRASWDGGQTAEAAVEVAPGAEARAELAPE